MDLKEKMMRDAKKAKVVLLVTAIAVIALPMFADSATYTLGLSGTVAQSCTLTITAASAASALPLTTKVTALTIATIIEKSNSGYLVTIASANGWDLKSGSNTMAYSILYGGTAVSTTTGSTAAVTITTSSSGTSSTGTSRILAVAFDGATTTPTAGNYTDTLTLTITSQ
jgi:hypothetical protein